MSDPYASISKGKLSFKNDKVIKKKKKKSKDEARNLDDKKVDLIKDAKLAEELIRLSEEKKIDKDLIEQIASKEIVKPNLTKAELAFRNKQEKMQAERVLKKASKTHKQRVEEFNTHLDNLSEHYECAKVSWTK